MTKAKIIYEMSKCDTKKKMKRVLVGALKKKSRKELFLQDWMTLIVFFNFHQLVQTDIKEAREQFSEYLKVSFDYFSR